MPDAQEAWFVYILLCADRTYYAGHTSDIEERVRAHNACLGAAHTAKRRPVVLVYSESAASEASAMAREKQLKSWTRAKKEALIAGDKELLHQLSRCRAPKRAGHFRQKVREISEEIEGELKWDATLAASGDMLEKMAKEAIEEFDLGKTHEKGFKALFQGGYG